MRKLFENHLLIKILKASVLIFENENLKQMQCLVGPRLLPGGNDIVLPQGGSKTSNMGILEKPSEGQTAKQ